MKLLKLVWILIIVTLFAGCTQNNEEILLKLDKKIGDEQVIVSTTETSAGAAMSIKSVIEISLKVSEFDKNVYTFTSDVLRIKSETKIGSDIEIYDSDIEESKMSESERLTHSEFHDVLVPKFKIKIDDKGNILEPFQYLNGNVVEFPIVDMSYIQIIFPKEKVKIGSKWSNEKTNSLTSQKIESIYRIKDITDKEIVILADLSISALSGLLDKNKAKGEYVLDKETYNLIKATFEMNLQTGGKVTKTYYTKSNQAIDELPDKKSNETIAELPSKNFNEIIPELAEGETLLRYCEGLNRCGYMDKNGVKVIAPIYKETKAFVNKFALVQKHDQQHSNYTYVNSLGKEIINPKFDVTTDHFSIQEDAREHKHYLKDEDIISLKGKDSEKYKHGAINDQGETICEPKYFSRLVFVNGFAIVRNRVDDEFVYGMVDKSCKEVLPIKYNQIKSELYTSPNKPVSDLYVKFNTSLFSDGLIAVKLGDKWGYINEHFKIAIPFSYEEASNFSEGLAAVKKDNKIAYINTQNKVIIPYSNNELNRDFSNNVVIAKSENKYYLINSDNNKIQLKNDYDDVSDFHLDVAIVKKDARKGLINKRGEEIKPLIYRYIGFDSGFVEGFIKSRLFESERLDTTLLNNQGQDVADTLFSDISNFSNGLAVVTKVDGGPETDWDLETSRGYIDKDGKLVIPYNYFSAKSFNENRAVVQKIHQGKFAIIDTDGKNITPYIYDYIGNYKDGYALVAFNGKVFYVDINGKPIGFNLSDVEDF